MTQTLTTERLREIAERRSPSLRWGEAEQIAAELLANREVQPVGYIDPDSLKEYRGQRAGGTWSAVQRTTSGLNMTVPIYLTAPPAPAPAVPDIFNNLIAHLNNAHNFIENTEAFGVAAASGIIECGDATWNIDASKSVLEKCRAAMLAAAPEGSNDEISKG